MVDNVHWLTWWLMGNCDKSGSKMVTMLINTSSCLTTTKEQQCMMSISSPTKKWFLCLVLTTGSVTAVLGAFLTSTIPVCRMATCAARKRFLGPWRDSVFMQNPFPFVAGSIWLVFVFQVASMFCWNLAEPAVLRPSWWGRVISSVCWEMVAGCIGWSHGWNMLK